MGRSNTFNDEIKKEYWTVREVVGMLGVAHSCIRYWEEAFDLKFHRNGIMRGYGEEIRLLPEQVETLKEIHRLLKVEKFTIEGAKQKLICHK